MDYLPKITVLMPVYNGSKYLDDAIKTILNQTFQNLEFVIIDDGSTDDSLNIIKSYNDNRIRLIENNENLFKFEGEENINVYVKKAEGKKCQRCWKIFPGQCPRCDNIS